MAFCVDRRGCVSFLRHFHLFASDSGLARFNIQGFRCFVRNPLRSSVDVQRLVWLKTRESTHTSSMRGKIALAGAISPKSHRNLSALTCLKSMLALCYAFGLRTGSAPFVSCRLESAEGRARPGPRIQFVPNRNVRPSGRLRQRKDSHQHQVQTQTQRPTHTHTQTHADTDAQTRAGTRRRACACRLRRLAQPRAGPCRHALTHTDTRRQHADTRRQTCGLQTRNPQRTGHTHRHT